METQSLMNRFIHSDKSLESQLQVIILDIYQLLPRHTDRSCVMNIEYNSRRLCYNLYCKWYELLYASCQQGRDMGYARSLVNSVAVYISSSLAKVPIRFPPPPPPLGRFRQVFKLSANMRLTFFASYI